MRQAEKENSVLCRILADSENNEILCELSHWINELEEGAQNYDGL